MIGVDTNILLRLVLRDDERQFALAVRLIDRLRTLETPAHVSLVVLAEFAWALRQSYRRPREEVANAIEGLLDASAFALEDEPLVRAALVAYRAGPSDFPDILIAYSNTRAGCSMTLTFDREAAKAGVMALLEETT